MTQRVDVRSNHGLILNGQLVTNTAMRSRVWKAAAAGHVVTISPARAPSPSASVSPSVSPSPSATALFDAGVFRGRGVVVGGNPDVWAQAYALAQSGLIDVVAVTPQMPAEWVDKLRQEVFVVGWWPPEQTGDDFHGDMSGFIVQAENGPEWSAAYPVVRDLRNVDCGVFLNSWVYGRLDGLVAFVECYYNEGWGVDFNIFRNYHAQGARAVIPVCGGYSATGRSDDECGRLYAALSTQGFPGFWMYGGESLLTEQSLEALRRWRS